jgi:hypothetical protein
VDEEMTAALEEGCRRLGWESFFRAWYRMVRRVVLGDGARTDEALTDCLAKLRANANWAFLKPVNKRLRAQYYERLRAHLARAEEGSLAALIAARLNTARTKPAHQVSQWLFAFDPGGIATFRTLACLTSHPQAYEAARAEANASGPDDPPRLPVLRASFLDALRLWPTAPAILRESRAETEWPGGRMPAGTGILIYLPFFHRDTETFGSRAHRFSPELWPGGEPHRGEGPLQPFSDGPGICPAHRLVPMLGACALATLVRGRRWSLEAPASLDTDRLPGTLDHQSLRFRTM